MGRRFSFWTKNNCHVCGGRVPKGRRYTCSSKCKREEDDRLHRLKKRLNEAQKPRMKLYNRVGDALSSLFGGKPQ